MAGCFGVDLRFPSFYLFIFGHAQKRIRPDPLLLPDDSLGSLIFGLVVTALPEASNMESRPDGIVIAMIFLLSLFAVNFGKCIKGLLADRIEKMLHVCWGVFIDHY